MEKTPLNVFLFEWLLYCAMALGTAHLNLTLLTPTWSFTSWTHQFLLPPDRSCILIYYLNSIKNDAFRLYGVSTGHPNLSVGASRAFDPVHRVRRPTLQASSHRETASADPPIRCLLVQTVDVDGCLEPFVHVFISLFAESNVSILNSSRISKSDHSNIAAK